MNYGVFAGFDIENIHYIQGNSYRTFHCTDRDGDITVFRQSGIGALFFSYPAGGAFCFASLNQINGEPWFVAADVCRALELDKTWNALQRLDDDEKSSIRSTDVTSNGGNPNISIVNEPGLYALVLGSRKPEAVTKYCGNVTK